MTHDELLTRVKEGQWVDRQEMMVRSNALRAVVELHKPIMKTYPSVFSSGHDSHEQQLVTRNYCEQCGYRYPCSTIQAIEKELQ